MTGPMPESQAPEPGSHGSGNRDARSTPAGPDPSSTGLQPNVAALLCYLLTWLTGVVFLLVERDSRFVRFHAAQSVFFGLAWAAGIFVFFRAPIGSAPGLRLLFSLAGALVAVAGFTLWILLMVKAFRGVAWRIPLIGDAAARTAGL